MLFNLFHIKAQESPIRKGNQELKRSSKKNQANVGFSSIIIHNSFYKLEVNLKRGNCLINLSLLQIYLVLQNVAILSLYRL